MNFRAISCLSWQKNRATTPIVPQYRDSICLQQYRVHGLRLEVVFRLPALDPVPENAPANHGPVSAGVCGSPMAGVSGLAAQSADLSRPEGQTQPVPKKPSSHCAATAMSLYMPIPGEGCGMAVHD